MTTPVDNLPLNQHLQLVACAGAGKTERVSRRVIRQLNEPGVRSENVVAITFNERAGAELKDRIVRRYEERHGTREGLADLYVGTIHGFCLDLLQRLSFEAVSFSVLSDVQQRHLITRNSRKCGLADLGWHRYHQAGTYADLMAVLREADIDEDALSGTDVDACLQKYLDLLHDKRYLDFTAFVHETVGLLEDDDDFRSKVKGRVQYLTVDEYQDVNPIQERLVAALSELGATITVVGDDDQLLYAWRGSSVANILEFTDRYPNVQISKLEHNFRSSRGIVDLARGVIVHNDPDRLPKAMVSAGNQVFEDGDIELLEFGSEEDEAEHIARRIQELLGRPFRDTPETQPRGLSYSDVAILVRVKKLIPAIAAALDAAKVPYVVGGISSLFEAPEAEAARELFAFLAGDSDAKALRRAWQAADIGLLKGDLDRAIATARADRSDIENGRGRFGVYNLQRSFLGFLEALELREEKIKGPSPALAHSRREVVYYNLGKFSEVISDFEQINFQSGPREKYASFHGFLQFQAAGVYPEGWLEARYVKPDAVQILTIHQAKGLQWPAVFVPGLTKERFPPRKPGGITVWHAIPDGVVRNRADYENADEDERRLFYVALTRAKKYLTVSRAPYRAPKLTWRRPSFLWDEALASCDAVAPPDPPAAAKRMKPTPQRLISDVSLSFSELKYAFECPYSFKLRFLYGFNPPIAEALGFGKGLHDALFELHTRALEGEPIDASLVPELVGRHLYLPFAYPDLRRTLTDAALRRLEAYIAARGATFEDIEHAERAIELDLGNGVRVTGRIDLIRRRSTSEVVIIDFKSSDRAQQEDVTALQLHVYALGYEQATGERAHEVVVDNLDDLSEKREPVTQAVLDEAIAAIVDAGEAMRDNRFPRRPAGADEKTRQLTCNRCDLTGICGGG